MTFHEVQFPVELSYGLTGGPQFNTSIVTVKSGQEQRNQNWAVSRYKWDASTAIKTRADMEIISGFFLARRGKLHGFRFKDWADFKTYTTQAIGTGTGALTTFQLAKNYSDAGGSYSRTITKPVAGTVKPYLNGVLQTSGFTVNTTTGVVTFSSAPGSGVAVTAEFEFDVPVRFDTDELKTQYQAFDQLVVDGIPIIEIRI